MAELPLPDRGQPLDVTYIYTMANTINQIASTVNLSTNRNIIVTPRGNQKQTLKNTDFQMATGYLFRGNKRYNSNNWSGSNCTTLFFRLSF